MIFGFGRKKGSQNVEEEEEEQEFVLFQGALNGQDADLAANARLAEAGLVPAKQLVSDALARRAETVRLEPKGKVAVSTFFVDGVPYPGVRMPAQAALAVTQMLKLLAGLDVRERSKPQSGGIRAEFAETPYELRVDSVPLKTGGERLTVRARNTKIRLETPDDLGFSSELKTKIRETAGEKEGLMLAAGPPGSGVTTTAIAIVRGIDAYVFSIVCLADLQGRDLPHVSVPDDPPTDTLEQRIARAKRAEGDVLFVDPIKSGETAKTLLNDSNDATIVAEMPAADAADAIVRLIAATKDPNLVADRLKLVLSQKLVRLLCTKCKHAYRPNPKLLAKVGLPPETSVLYRPPSASDEDAEEDVCSKCGGIGYFGRTGLIEAINVSDAVKQLIQKGADAKAIRVQARKESMQTFQSDGLRLVAEGMTSLEELQRAFKNG